MNLISKSSIKKALRTTEQIYLTEDPTILKDKKNKTFN